MNKFRYEGLRLSSYNVVSNFCLDGTNATPSCWSTGQIVNPMQEPNCTNGDIPFSAYCAEGFDASGGDQFGCKAGTHAGEKSYHVCGSGNTVNMESGCVSGPEPQNPGSCNSGTTN